MKRLTALLFLSCSPLFANDVTLTWTAASGAVGYRIHVGQASTDYGQVVDTGAGPTTASLNSVLVPNTINYLALTAYNAAGESGFSSELAGWPRPIVNAALITDEGSFYRATISGSNFSDLNWSPANVDLQYPGLVVADARRIDSGTLEIDYSCSGCDNGSATLTINNIWTNPDDPSGLDGVPGVDSSAVVVIPDVIPPPPGGVAVD
jgi:hypothetical protein